MAASQDVLSRGRSVWVNHPKRFFCSLNSFSVERLPVTKHKLAIPSAKWTYKQFEDFIEVVKLIVGNFRRSWIINTIYECHSGWSVCCCCFVTVMSHVACGSTFIEKPSWYGLFPLFSPSKLSITFSLIDGLHFEEQLHKDLSFLPFHSQKQAKSSPLPCVLFVKHVNCSSVPCHLVCICLSNFTSKMSQILAVITALWAYLPLTREHFFYLVKRHGKCG